MVDLWAIRKNKDGSTLSVLVKLKVYVYLYICRFYMLFDIEASRFIFVHARRLLICERRYRATTADITKQHHGKSHTKQIYGNFIILMGKIHFKYIFFFFLLNMYYIATLNIL